ncbi:hypothetical protein [Streptomyces sp. CAU 1734]|uniref:hypothetical protein n=1 Tax=Streptomyces sp. CAU 1734 TaxID=3140360 RepID=UPI0032607C02
MNDVPARRTTDAPLTRAAVAIDRRLSSSWGIMAMVAVLIGVSLAYPPLSAIGSAVILAGWFAIGRTAKRHERRTSS